MDGMLINTPYFSKMPDLPTRCRFSPLLFNGSVFSTGGYSAEFGQALSSIVALNTTALEPEDKSSISLLSVGVQGSHARRWKSSSLALQGELLHMGLSNKIFKQNINWINEPVVAGSTLMFRQKTSETGMIKTFGSFSYNTSSLIYNNFQESAFQDIALKNRNGYLNSTYNEQLNKNWILNSGIAFNLDLENIKMDDTNVQATKGSGQVKVSFTNLSIKNITTKLGADYLFSDYSQNLRMDGDFLLSFSNHQFSMFLESEVKVTKYFALRSGFRAEFNTLMANVTMNPRLSAAIKTGEFSQFSAAFGTFTQNPEDEYLKFTAKLAPEKSRHSIITWQYKKGEKTLRLEAYHKNYSNLVKFKEEFSIEKDSYSNDGAGYSRGIDIFWRHQKEFGKSDYWISYSWNDSKRNYRDFPVPATPHYVSEHNLSVVYKRFFTKLNSFASATWSFASGRPYFNPNNPVFMSDRTKAYKDISLGLTHILYLFKTQTVVHLIVNNVCGFNNIYGYTFTKIPDNQGIYHSQPVRPPQKQLAVILISFQL
jgi:membrane-bound inhibitor of C-type lysozyme